MFTCSECRKRFTQSSYLLIHQRVHTGERPITCSDWDEIHSVILTSDTSSSKLLINQWVHTGERPFTCSVYGKRFTQSSYLLIRQVWERIYSVILPANTPVVHTGERPFTCSESCRRFTQSSYLLIQQ
ncbi:gastrula zinc finger protein xLCGF3.1-like [Heterodontus francisci]|uniref:gastrula zinc finger protein xLCGF3.1-like n=1 Tax=Heterodontus francisci TaxID=7792 RepID=UPI00355C91A3